MLETSQHIFIVLERVKGGELFDYILQKGRLPRQESLRIIAQIIQGTYEFVVLTCSACCVRKRETQRDQQSFLCLSLFLMKDMFMHLYNCDYALKLRFGSFV